MHYYKNGNGILATINELPLTEITEEEYKSALMSAEKKQEVRSKILDRLRPMKESEVSRLLIAQQINTLSVDDNTALRMVEFYPEWASGVAYTEGYKVQCIGKLWRCLQAHTSQTGWEPSVNTASLWDQICETHDGTLADPIPYDGNMALENGKYYIQDYVIYLCTRGTGNPVYNPLADLVGLYVTKVQGG